MQIGFALWSLVNTRSLHTVRLKKNLGWVWVTSLIVFLSAGSFFIRDFGNVSQVQEIQSLTNLPEFIELNFENAISKNSFFKMDTGEFEISDNTLTCKNVETTFNPSAENPQLVKIKHARGQDFAKAKDRAGNINYQIAQNKDSWTIPTYFDIEKGNQWRAQKIILDFQIPIGQKFKITKEDRFQINGIDYSNCKTSEEYYLLEMTEAGLQPLLINS